MTNILLYLMSACYVYAGVSHFRKPYFFLKMMPPIIPYPKFWVDFSGVVEIILGLGLLLEATRSWSAWGIIGLLIVVFPANVYMLTSGRFHKFPKAFLIARLPLQLVLIWWAYQYV